VGEYEIGSEAWMRERIEQGLDPAEGDRPKDDYLLRIDAVLPGPAGRPAEVSQVPSLTSYDRGWALTS
jgi:hypothetical protein